MKAMILAAGRGERLRPLTDHTPKPLVKLHGRSLIDYHLQHLAEIGVKEVVINVSYQAEKIMAHVGDGQHFGLQVHFSVEKGKPLGTGGGIFQALPLLGRQPFILLSADIWGDYPLRRLPQSLTGWLHLVLVPTPVNYAGDFYLQNNQLVQQENGQPILTYGGIGVVDPVIFHGCAAGEYSLNPLLRAAIRQGKATGECYLGHLLNITSLKQLKMLV